MMMAMVLVGAASAQDVKVTKKTEVVQNADGTYTVIEYPVGKEVTIDLTPVTTVTGSTGVARVMRAADGTKVWVDRREFRLLRQACTHMPLIRRACRHCSAR